MAEFLLELLSEEIPAPMQARAGDDLARLTAGHLKNAGLEYESARAFATPRRLCLVIDGLALAQPDISEERRGPKADAPGKAVEGFAKSSGLARGQLEVRESGKGAYYYAHIETKGRATAEVLAEIVPQVMARFPWPKSMRWGAGKLKWVRPLHSILCLFDGKAVDFQVGGIAAGKRTRGHRFMAPEPFGVSGFADYEKKLRQAKVMLDAADRREIIVREAAKAAKAVGCAVVDDPDLLDEVAGLVEWPVVLLGDIDRSFMDLPPEVLAAALGGQQKYFSLTEAKSGDMATHFVAVSNMAARDKGAEIVKGYERVLSARLADAKFFWDQDRKVTLESRVEALDGVVFHAQLGSLGDKAKRMDKIAREIESLLEQTWPGEVLPGDVIDAARWCKADLTTGMVGEFPELQGIMGRYYVLDKKQTPEVADAIAEHYQPKGPDDNCPTKPVSIIIALADKIDTLVQFFAINEKPTGSKDPFALRRAALGVIRLIIENKLHLPLMHLFEVAYHAGGQSNVDSGESVAKDILTFLVDRLTVHLRKSGVRHDLISAVFALEYEDDLVQLLERVDALSQFIESEDGSNLLTAYKRASRIVQIEEEKDGASFSYYPNEEQFEQPEEKALHDTIRELGLISDETTETADYVSAMEAMAKLRKPVDDFFDKVTVNCDEPELRKNRLLLLSRIKATMDMVADFSKIEG